MKKALFIAAMLFLGSVTFYSCKSTGGGCDAFGGSHALNTSKEVGKSL